jgi:DNA replication protein DnaC
MQTSAKQPPLRFNDAKFSELPKDLQDLVLNIRTTRKGAYIWGPVGTGKTYAAFAILKQLGEMGLRARFHTAPELMDLLRDDFDHKDSYNLERLLENRGVLIVDDLGTEKASDWVAETLHKIVDKRYREVLPMIITSNLSLDQLAERIGDRIPSRLSEMCEVIKLDGDDRRLSTPRE